MMAQNTMPENWREEPCFLVAIPRSLVPYVAGLMKIAESRGFWATAEDYLRGYAAVTELERCMMATCLDDLINGQNALYRLVNTVFRGEEYSTVTEDPLVIEPPIAPFVNLDILNQASVLGYLDRQTQLIDNTINGTETPLYSYSPSVKEQLQAIIDALAAEDTDLGDLLTQLELIAGLLA
jgi:hypothetical protein